MIIFIHNKTSSFITMNKLKNTVTSSYCISFNEPQVQLLFSQENQNIITSRYV